MIWAAIKHALNSTVGTANFKPLDEQITDICNVPMLQRGSVIRSVQRGTVQIASGVTSYAPMTIAPVTPEKCVVKIIGCAGWFTRLNHNDHFEQNTCYVESLTSTLLTIRRSMTIANSTNQGVPFTWEVVEYY